MAEKEQTKTTTQSARISDLEGKLGQAMQVIEGLQSRLSLLDYQAEAIEMARKVDPNECIKRAREIVEKNRSLESASDKRYTWEITRPDVYKSMYHHTDEGNRNAAIREWEERVGTKLVTNRHKESENDTFNLINDKLKDS
jgi:hypothetical protein|tara:strand:- start:182 stop:604 length:423 start_codon:yes stop_codon:yes gene_type:complete